MWLLFMRLRRISLFPFFTNNSKSKDGDVYVDFHKEIPDRFPKIFKRIIVEWATKVESQQNYNKYFDYTLQGVTLTRCEQKIHLETSNLWQSYSNNGFLK